MIIPSYCINFIRIITICILIKFVVKDIKLQLIVYVDIEKFAFLPYFKKLTK